MTTDTTNAFATFYGLGYTRLVPIVPPDAEISPSSSLARRKDARGKAVGVRGRDGLWRGMDWIGYEADEHDLKRWHAMGAGVGIKTGSGLVAIDADTLNADYARTIRDITEEHFGRLPVRVGRYPKALYLVRIKDDYRYSRITFGEDNERVEVLSDGRQFVAHGIHPVTQAPYGWPREIVPFDDLPVVSAEELNAYLADLQRTLPKAKEIEREGSTGDRANVNQEALRGQIEHVRKAVAAIPNDERFDARESYIALGAAIKASLPDDPATALQIWTEWAETWTEGPSRWPGGQFDPWVVEKDFQRLKGPFQIGAGYIYDLAERISPQKFSQAEIWFEKILPEETENLKKFDDPFKKEADAGAALYPLLTIGELVSRPPPTWLVARHIPETSVGFLYADPGAGKTFLALDLALSIAAGRSDWHGDAIHATGRPVIYVASEGSFGMRNRILAWLKARECDAPAGFLILERTINFMSSDDVVKLMRTLRAVAFGPPALIVVDTVSRALPGADENLQKDMTLFIRACDAVKEAFGCAVLGVHHAGKSGDMRGSTVLRGAGDFVFGLTRKEGATVGQLRCEKQKDGPDGWQDSYRFDVVHVGDGQSSWVPARADASIGPSVKLTPDTSARVLADMRAAWEAGRPWSPAPQSKERYAVRRMVSDHGFTSEKANETLELWAASGLIRVEVYSAKARVSGYQVTGDVGQVVPNDGIFG